MNTLETTAAPARPWYIGLLLGASGWLAGGFLLVFVAMLFHPDSAGAAAVSGAVSESGVARGFQRAVQNR